MKPFTIHYQSGGTQQTACIWTDDKQTAITALLEWDQGAEITEGELK